MKWCNKNEKNTCNNTDKYKNIVQENSKREMQAKITAYTFQETKVITTETTWTWLRSGHLNKTTKSLLMAISNIFINPNHLMAKETVNSNCVKNVNHIVSRKVQNIISWEKWSTWNCAN